jgi:hypothetical protein
LIGLVLADLPIQYYIKYSNYELIGQNIIHKQPFYANRTIQFRRKKAFLKKKTAPPPHPTPPKKHTPKGRMFGVRKLKTND